MTNKKQKICVFCGSHEGSNPYFRAQTIKLGNLLADNNYELIYGGANVGLMKILAENYLIKGRNAIGIIPDFLADKHLVQPGLTKTIIVKNMQERKQKMASMADAFVALPGGYGTLEELFEVITASQLSLHKKPIVIGNLEGFYDHLLAHRDSMIKNGFVDENHRHTFLDAGNAEAIIEALKKYVAPNTPKYIEQVQRKYNKNK